ncbi:alkaline phosphatase family protein [Carboxylicivirga linearis]|uniref:Alkaline phosphatase family protein n=1 Tax=Carboxylicivirga linearis TaxID=1628157 RepID=A0ABS5JRQ7_9BACT|nr:ectonucleotide pyrophosphatase/phosphodiesterase [Carboxylicivirga linearis]MBS2097530.1 alkaline phosphatase family protein [Carboxylicivirga linearis]
MRLFKILSCFIICLFVSCDSLVVENEHHKPYLLVVSLDGFRWDYQDLYNTPFLDSIEKVGAKAKSLQPSFPSKTFPNHYSIATGLYPDHHGLVANSFYSKKYADFYKVRDREKVQDGNYYGGEPIWVTVEKNGIKSASYFWVGTEADVQGIRPTYWKQYDSAIGYSARIDSVVSWLNLPYNQRPHLCMLYFDEPDGVGHNYGPESDSTRIMVNRLDAYLSELTNKINDIGIKDSIDIIILSDHGMGAINDERKVVINQIIDTAQVNYITGSNPFYLLDAKEPFIKKIKNELNCIPGIQAWEKDSVPDYLHYGTNKNIASLIVVADSAYSIVADPTDMVIGGTHGYDPTNKDMHGIFYAFGPSFKNGYASETFENIQIYELMCHILGVRAVDNDGDLKVTEDLLK